MKWTRGPGTTRPNNRGFMSGLGKNLPSQRGSGFWPGNEHNRTEPPVKTRTAGRLPGPVANTRSTQRLHLANQGNSGLVAELVRVHGALRSVRSKEKLEAEQ